MVRQDNGGIEVNIGGEVSYGSTPVNDGNWHHIAITVPNSTSGIKMFIDGSQQTFASGITDQLEMLHQAKMGI